MRLHVLSPRNGEPVELPDEEPTDASEDCVAECWRHVPGGHECRCDDEHEDGTTAAPGGW